MVRIGIYNTRVGTVQSGGTETFLREMMRRLTDEHEVTLYTGEGHILNEVSALDIDIVSLPWTTFSESVAAITAGYTPFLPAEIESVSMYLSARRQGVLADIKQNIDVLSTHYYIDNILLSRLDFPTVFRFPGIKSPSWRWRAMARFSDPTVYLANSFSTKKRAEEWLDVPIDGVVYPGVDVEAFSPDVEPAFSSDRSAILYVGRLEEGKGLRELIKAQRMLGELSDLYLVGGGYLLDDLRALVRNYGIDTSVKFVGPVPHSDIHRYYAAADIFCLPSYHESLGIVNLEAMAAGLPVVSTRIDAIQEYIEEGYNGFLVEPGDVNGLVDRLNRLIKSNDLRERFSDRSQITVERFAWDEQARQLGEYYEEAARISRNSDA